MPSTRLWLTKRRMLSLVADYKYYDMAPTVERAMEWFEG